MDALATFAARALRRALPPETLAMAEAIRSRHHNVQAVLAYGSTLRGVATADTLMDFYVLTATLADVSPNIISRAGAALLPPNVYYAECSVNGQTFRAKYAVLTLARFARKMRVGNPYFWARFAQPTALILAADAAAEAAVAEAVAQALRTGWARALALHPQGPAAAQWSALFAETYRTELRPEGQNRPGSIVTAWPDYYDEAARLMADVAPHAVAWPLRRLEGKLLTMLRLAKAGFTFAGGADYIVWKIERHSGAKITLTDWQRRHPLIAGLLHLPSLLRRGAIR